MKLRIIRRIYKQHLLWEKNMSKNISLLEVIVLFTIVVCIVVKYAPTLENNSPKYQHLGDFPIDEIKDEIPQKTE